MSILESIILGIVQGLTEFLPVSSSAHLRITSELLGIGDAGAAFTAITQIGTEAAVIFFFWRDIVRVISAWFGSLTGRVAKSDPDAKMGWWIILGSIPIIVLGLLFQDMIETSLRSLWFTGTSLIVFGVLLGVADQIGRSHRGITDLTFGRAVTYGFAQAMALIPGVSRSGGTITAGRLMGYDRESAARYSFLLAIPAVLGSGFYQLFKVVKAPAEHAGNASGATILVATIVAFVIAIIVIKWFMGYISRRSFMPFVIYRVALGIAILILVATGVLDPGGSTTAMQSLGGHA